LTVEGSTHASNVIPLDSCNDAELGTVTTELVPLNFNAPPNFPAVLQVVFATVPLFPFPDASVTVVPDPSSNPYAATRAGGSALAACEIASLINAGFLVFARTI
jgi:hypothetical protein